jgi:hypothetical protein
MGSERVPLILLQIRSGGGAVAFRTLVPYPMDTVGSLGFEAREQFEPGIRLGPLESARLMLQLPDVLSTEK